MKEIKNNWVLIIGAVLLILCLVIFFAAKAFSAQQSYVEVKGLSEKIVKADTAIWSMSFVVKSNDIDGLYSDLQKNISSIKDFLKQKGFEASEINVAPVNIYQDTYKDSQFRYNASEQVSVYTNKVDLARSTSNDTLLLVKKGVILNQNNISFEVSDINSIKPDMLTEAIKNAKDTALQFAQKSGSFMRCWCVQ